MDGLPPVPPDIFIRQTCEIFIKECLKQIWRGNLRVNDADQWPGRGIPWFCQPPSAGTLRAMKAKCHTRFGPVTKYPGQKNSYKSKWAKFSFDVSNLSRCAMYCAEKDVLVFICQLLTLAVDDEEPNSCSRIFMMFLKGAMSKQRVNLWL